VGDSVAIRVSVAVGESVGVGESDGEGVTVAADDGVGVAAVSVVSEAGDPNGTPATTTTSPATKRIAPAVSSSHCIIDEPRASPAPSVSMGSSLCSRFSPGGAPALIVHRVQHRVVLLSGG